MAIVTIKASKATPGKALEYITDKGKAAMIGAHQLDPNQDLAKQMMMTAKLWGKAQDENARKYYHLKIAFDPKDWTRNGGPLTEREAMEIGTRIMLEFFPGSESVGSVHTDKDHLHFHGVINAVDMQSGKMVDMRDADYRRLKDRVQEICAERGLTAIDWRKATKQKRDREVQSDLPITETFAEQGLKERGKTTWKDDLRERIDAAVKESCTMSEFKAQLQARGVELTRCTEKTISYRLEGREKGCRGDTLGGDYTVAAIQDALEHNSIEPAPEQSYRSLDAMISRAERGDDRELTQEERAMYRDLGRAAGFKRAEIDEMCDRASWATWEEKQAVWSDYKAARDEFWGEYNIRSQSIQSEINELYMQRKKAKQMEWVLDSRNRRKSLGSVLVAGIYFSRHEDSAVLELKIRNLKQDLQQLRKEAATFKSTTGAAVETLREKGHTLDAYMKSVKSMQAQADSLYLKNTAGIDLSAIDRLKKKKEIRNKGYER